MKSESDRTLLIFGVQLRTSIYAASTRRKAETASRKVSAGFSEMPRQRFLGSGNYGALLDRNTTRQCNVAIDTVWA